MSIRKSDFNLRIRGSHLLLTTLAAIFLFSAICAAQEPSTDRKNPTPFASNTVEGEYDGAPTAHFYRFIANKGSVKVTATAQTQAYSKLVDIELLDENGNKLESFTVHGQQSAQTASVTKTFIRRQPVTIKVVLPQDNDIKHLKYQIQLDGPVEFEQAAMQSPPSQQAGQAMTAQPPMEMNQGMPDAPLKQMGSSNRMCLPESGTLVLETTSGEAFEIDLKKVTKASVKP